MKHDPCCGTHQPRSTSLDPSQGAEAPDSAGAHAQTQGRDPVCGMTPSRNTPYRAGYDGREYLFCSSPCLQKFKAGPAEYVKNDKAVVVAKPRPGRGAVHTCPMHPEVRQTGPGACPKCGVALEPVEPEAAPSRHRMDVPHASGSRSRRTAEACRRCAEEECKGMSATAHST